VNSSLSWLGQNLFRFRKDVEFCFIWLRLYIPLLTLAHWLSAWLTWYSHRTFVEHCQHTSLSYKKSVPESVKFTSPYILSGVSAVCEQSVKSVVCWPLRHGAFQEFQFSLSLRLNTLIGLKCTICLEAQIAVEAKAPLNLLTFVWMRE
jgi:hypothetical protein